MSSKTAQAYGALARSDVFLIDPRKVVIEEDDPSHPDYQLHEPRRKIQERELRLIRQKGAKALGEVRVKTKKLDDGSSVVVMRDGRTRIRHARVVLREKLEAMGADYDTFEPSKDDPLPLMVRAVPEDDPDATQILNAYAKKDPPLMIAAKVDEYFRNNVPVEQIGVLVNRSAKSIASYRKLWTDAIQPVKDALHEDRISFNVAVELADKSAQGQADALARILERGAKRGRAARDAAAGKDETPAPRFRAPAAKLAAEVETLPHGPERHALEWALGRRDLLVEPRTSEEVEAALTLEKERQRVEEMGHKMAELRAQIDALRAEHAVPVKDASEESIPLLGAAPVKVTKDNVAAAVAESKERQRANALEAELEKLKNASSLVAVENVALRQKVDTLSRATSRDPDDVKEIDELKKRIETLQLEVERTAAEASKRGPSVTPTPEAQPKSVAEMLADAGIDPAKLTLHITVQVDGEDKLDKLEDVTDPDTAKIVERAVKLVQEHPARDALAPAVAAKIAAFAAVQHLKEIYSGIESEIEEAKADAGTLQAQLDEREAKLDERESDAREKEREAYFSSTPEEQAEAARQRELWKNGPPDGPDPHLNDRVAFQVRRALGHEPFDSTFTLTVERGPKVVQHD